VSGSESESDTDSNISAAEDKEFLKTEEGAGGRVEVLANPFSGGNSGGGGRLLPKPSFLQESEKIAGIKFDSSVFSNPFRFVGLSVVFLSRPAYEKRLVRYLLTLSVMSSMYRKNMALLEAVYFTFSHHLHTVIN